MLVVPMAETLRNARTRGTASRATTAAKASYRWAPADPASISVVTPVLGPSRFGSMPRSWPTKTWVCRSIQPGVTSSPAASITVAAVASSKGSAKAPSSTKTSARAIVRVDGSKTSPPRMIVLLVSVIQCHPCSGPRGLRCPNGPAKRCDTVRQRWVPGQGAVHCIGELVDLPSDPVVVGMILGENAVVRDQPQASTLVQLDHPGFTLDDQQCPRPIRVVREPERHSGTGDDTFAVLGADYCRPVGSSGRPAERACDATWATAEHPAVAVEGVVRLQLQGTSTAFRVPIPGWCG